MKKKQGVLVLILTVVLIGLLAFTTAVGFGPTGTGSAKNIKTGLDLSGGVSITYQAKGDDPSQEDMAPKHFNTNTHRVNVTDDNNVDKTIIFDDST